MISNSILNLVILNHDFYQKIVGGISYKSYFIYKQFEEQGSLFLTSLECIAKLSSIVCLRRVLWCSLRRMFTVEWVWSIYEQYFPFGYCVCWTYNKY